MIIWSTKANGPSVSLCKVSRENSHFSGGCVSLLGFLWHKKFRIPCNNPCRAGFPLAKPRYSTRHFYRLVKPLVLHPAHTVLRAVNQHRLFRLLTWVKLLLFLVFGLAALARKLASTVLFARLFWTVWRRARRVFSSVLVQGVSVRGFKRNSFGFGPVRAAAGVESGEGDVVGHGLHPGADADISAVRRGEVRLVVVMHVRMVKPLRVDRGPWRREHGGLGCEVTREVHRVPGGGGGTWRPRGHCVRRGNKTRSIHVLRLVRHQRVHIAVSQSATGRHFDLFLVI